MVCIMVACGRFEARSFSQDEFLNTVYGRGYCYAMGECPRRGQPRCVELPPLDPAYPLDQPEGGQCAAGQP